MCEIEDVTGNQVGGSLGFGLGCHWKGWESLKEKEMIRLWEMKKWERGRRFS